MRLQRGSVYHDCNEDMIHEIIKFIDLICQPLEKLVVIEVFESKL